MEKAPLVWRAARIDKRADEQRSRRHGMKRRLVDHWRRRAPAFILKALALCILSSAPAGAQVIGQGLGQAQSPALSKPTTIERILARGHIVCGFTRALPGFSVVNPRGQWSGFDVDFCRALAAGLLGKPEAVKPLVIAPAVAAAALISGEIDILATGTAISLSRETGLGLRFPGVLYHDATTLIVKRAQGVTSARELSGASICVGNNPETIEALAGFFKAHGIRHETVIVEKWEEMVQAYTSGRCQALCADAAMLAELRTRLSASGEHHILPEALAISPLGPAVRRGDPTWYDTVRWAIHALVAAEQLGISTTRVESLKASAQLDVRRMLGVEGDIGKPLGLQRDWVYQMVRAVGNYGEIYERNLGQRSPLKLERRTNELWNKGGLMVAPHLR